ncbi:MAG: ankyrin repeat domain-containing protein, partial [Alphaproteobacteria bacterium]
GKLDYIVQKLTKNETDLRINRKHDDIDDYFLVQKNILTKDEVTKFLFGYQELNTYETFFDGSKYIIRNIFNIARSNNELGVLAKISSDKIHYLLYYNIYYILNSEIANFTELKKFLDEELTKDKRQTSQQLTIKLIKHKFTDTILDQDQYLQALFIICSIPNTETEMAANLLNLVTDIDAGSNTRHTALILASMNGNTEIVKLLLERKAKINATDKNGKTALIWAAENGHTSMVQLLINAGAKINVLTKNTYNTALILAIIRGHTEIAKALIEAGANINISGNNGRTALIHAVLQGNTLIIKALIAANAYTETVDNIDRTALIWAAHLGDASTVQTLIEADADINVADNNKYTALILAAIKGHITIVNLLITAGANTDLANKDKKTALIWSANQGHTTTVQALIDAGADINARDNNGWTALIHAAQQGHIAIVQALITARANIEARDNNGWTALMDAAQNGHTATVQALIAAGANIDASDNYGYTVLMYAAQLGHTATVQALIAAGANIDASDNNGWTALIHAAQQGHTATIQALIAAGANIDASDNYGYTVLMYAASDGHTATVKALIDAKVDIEIKNKNGDTALILAANQGHIATVKALIEAGANIEAQDNMGCTALEHAIFSRNFDMMKVIISSGKIKDSISFEIFNAFIVGNKEVKKAIFHFQMQKIKIFLTNGAINSIIPVILFLAETLKGNIALNKSLRGFIKLTSPLVTVIEKGLETSLSKGLTLDLSLITSKEFIKSSSQLMLAIAIAKSAYTFISDYTQGKGFKNSLKNSIYEFGKTLALTGVSSIGSSIGRDLGNTMISVGEVVFETFNAFFASLLYTLVIGVALTPYEIANLAINFTKNLMGGKSKSTSAIDSFINVGSKIVENFKALISSYFVPIFILPPSVSPIAVQLVTSTAFVSYANSFAKEVKEVIGPFTKMVLTKAGISRDKEVVDPQR